MQLETKIPVKRHLKKFITKETGTDTLKLGSSNMYSRLFDSFFTKEATPTDCLEVAKDQKWTYIYVRYTFDDLKRKGFTVSGDSVTRFNQVVEEQFRGLLLHNIQIRRELIGNFNMKATIINFLRKYGITEEEMKYETIVKWVQRQLKDKNGKANMFSPN